VNHKCEFLVILPSPPCHNRPKFNFENGLHWKAKLPVYSRYYRVSLFMGSPSNSFCL